MQHTSYRWDQVPPIIESECLRQAVITGDRIMMAHAQRRRGCRVPLHEHANEQMTYVMQGCLRFWLGERGESVVTLNAGEVLHVPSHLPHRAEALEDTIELNVFSPPRDEWR